MDLLFASHRHLAVLTVDAVKAEDDGRLKVPVEVKRDRLHNLIVGWLEVAMANIGWGQPVAGRTAALELAPEADDIDPVDEAEHDEVDEALLADDPEDEVLPDEVEAPAEVVVPTKVAVGMVRVDIPGEDRMLACLA